LSRPAGAVRVPRRARAGRPARAGLALTLALAATLTSPPAAAADTAPARVIVTLKSDASLLHEQPLRRRAAQAAAEAVQRRADWLAARAGVALSAGTAVSERAQVVSARGIGAAELARRLAADPQVESAVVDHRRRALAVPADPLFLAGPASGLGPAVGQWYLRAPAGEAVSAVNAQAAWDRAAGRAAVVVAVLDTGVLADHLDLAGAVLPGYDMIADVPTANDGDGRDADATDAGDWITAGENASGDFRGCGSSDSSWHGTKIAGLIGAIGNNGQGMAGTAYGVRILPVRVLGKCGGFDSDILAGMRWAAGLDVPGLPPNPSPARIVNLSLGGSGRCDGTGYPAVIAELQAAGVAIVAAAGNSAGRAVELPANCPGVIAVAGLRHAGTKVGFSDLGPEIAISAPAGNCVNLGENEPCLFPILTTTNTGTRRPNAGGSAWTDSYDYSVGTSFAAPIVAGSLALMASARPQLLPEELLRLVQASARPFPTGGAGSAAEGGPVPQCRAPDGVDQEQCHCRVGLCGAGMLDAARAVAAADGVLPRIAIDPPAPRVGETIRLSAAGSLPGVGAVLAGQSWTVADAGGAVGALDGGALAVEVALPAIAEGTATIRLAVSDDRGRRATVEQAITVRAADAPADPGTAGGGGGGAFGGLALLGLAGAVLALRRRR
jgi:serine protease